MDGQRIFIHDCSSGNVIMITYSNDVPNVGEELVIYNKDGIETSYEVTKRIMIVYQGNQSCAWRLYIGMPNHDGKRNPSDDDNASKPVSEPEVVVAPEATDVPVKKTTAAKNNKKKKK